MSIRIRENIRIHIIISISLRCRIRTGALILRFLTRDSFSVLAFAPLLT